MQQNQLKSQDFSQRILCFVSNDIINYNDIFVYKLPYYSAHTSAGTQQPASIMEDTAIRKSRSQSMRVENLVGGLLGALRFGVNPTWYDRI